MKKIIRVLLSSCFVFLLIPTAFAQIINPEINGITLAPVLTGGNKVEEAPFFNEQWSEGSVMVNINSKPFFIQKMKYDLKEDKVLISNEQGVFAFPKGSILGFSLKIFNEKKSSTQTYHFLSGIEGVANYTPANFFLVHYNSDKIKFLEKIDVVLQQAPGSSYGSSTKDFVYAKREKYFIYKDNKGIEVKKNKKSILEVLGKDNKELENFIKVNKLNLKKTDDIVALLKYFETKI
ncbi:MAG: hypothetical protein OHK0045_03230 [Raineya sp.]